MDAKTFLDTVLRPTLMDMDMWSASAEKLLLMTACHESMGFRHRKQLGGGPARGFYQMEPATLEDLYLNYLDYRPDLKALLDRFKPHPDCTVEEALLDDRFATAAARLKYCREPEALPPVEENNQFARYWKSYWNTYLGKGTVLKFLQDWDAYRGEYE